MNQITARTVYHGSGETVVAPKVIITEYTKDFGCGFYCTVIEKQAHRWAVRKKYAKNKPNIPTVNVYRFHPTEDLKWLKFESMTEEWLDFIAQCRSSKGTVPHQYDIVEGPMADDDVWDYVEDFLSGRISREAFWALVKFKYPTHQISFHTEKALRCLEFEEAVLV